MSTISTASSPRIMISPKSGSCRRCGACGNKGKIRFIGVTEGFVQDPSHQMLQQSLNENLWDVVMVGFNLLNPAARRTVFPMAREKGVGVLNMFAVRRALSQPDRLKAIVAELSPERSDP